MSEHVSPGQDPQESPFSAADLKYFDAEDAEAGRAIGKMLSLFFLYTVFAMTGAACATYYWISRQQLQ